MQTNMSSDILKLIIKHIKNFGCFLRLLAIFQLIIYPTELIGGAFLPEGFPEIFIVLFRDIIADDFDRGFWVGVAPISLSVVFSELKPPLLRSNGGGVAAVAVTEGVLC